MKNHMSLSPAMPNLKALEIKNLILLFLLSMPIISFSQLLSHVREKPFLYVDSTLRESLYLNPASIESLTIGRETPRGEIYITCKKGVTFYTLNEVLNKYLNIKDKHQSLLYIINGHVINDEPEKVIIDASYIKSVDKISLADVTYVHKKFDNLTIIKILLSETDDKKEIRIRGTDISASTINK